MSQKSNNLVKITLHGFLGEVLKQKEWKLNIQSVAEGFRAIDILSKHKFTKYLVEKGKEYTHYRILVNGKDLIVKNQNDINSVLSSELFIKNKKLKTIDFIPVIEGAIAPKIIAAIIIAVVLIAVAVAAYFLVKPPPFDDFREIDGTTGRTSYLFNGPQNTTREGGPVPVGYGRLIVGSQVISAAYSVRNVSAESGLFFPGQIDSSWKIDGHKIGRTSAIALQAQANDTKKLITVGHVLQATNLGTAVVAKHRLFKFNNEGGYLRTLNATDLNGFANDIQVYNTSSDTTNYQKILVATSNDRLYRFNRDGSLDTTFDTVGYITVNDRIDRIAIMSGVSPAIIIVGKFTTITTQAGATSCKRIGKFNNNGTIESATFHASNVGANDRIRSVALDSSDNIFISGDFNKYTDIPSGETTSQNVAKLSSTGTLSTSFSTNINNGPNGSSSVWAIGLQSTGKIMIGGDFKTFDDSVAGKYTRNRILRLSSDGTLDSTVDFVTTFEGQTFSYLDTANEVEVITVQTTDDKPIVGGTFRASRDFKKRKRDRDTLETNPTEEWESPVGLKGLFRMTSAGALDLTFDSGADIKDGGIQFRDNVDESDFLVLSDPLGKELGTDIGSILDFFGGGDTVQDSVTHIIIDYDNRNKIYIAGIFNRYNGAKVRNIMRLHNPY